VSEVTVRADGLITPSQAAELCGVSRKTVYGWIAFDILPTARHDRRRILLNLLDVARADIAMRAGGCRAPAPPPRWALEEEPGADLAAVLTACWEQARQTPMLRRPVVYYLRFGDRIKIGTTVGLTARLSNIPHNELLATEPGGSDVETARHRQFAALRIYREWFRPGPVLVDHIAALRAESGIT
jgi:helix-turn-helix protein